jgi:hypothetical protein
MQVATGRPRQRENHSLLHIFMNRSEMPPRVRRSNVTFPIPMRRPQSPDSTISTMTIRKFHQLHGLSRDAAQKEKFRGTDSVNALGPLRVLGSL